MWSHAAGLRTAAIFGLLLSAAGVSACNQALTGARENTGSQPPPPPPPPLAILPSALELLVGQSVQLRTSGGDGSGWYWVSTDSSVASVSASGMVTATRAGTATIVAGDGSDCVFTSARPLNLKSVPGSGGHCAYTTIFVLEEWGRGRR